MKKGGIAKRVVYDSLRVAAQTIKMAYNQEMFDKNKKKKTAKKIMAKKIISARR